jgi:hypothetical protein
VGAPLAPLNASTEQEAREQLALQRASFRETRSLMRVRATTAGKTQSFRAQLIVRDAKTMELIAYTPVGTTALRLHASGNDITSEPPVAPEAFAFFRNAGLTPAETAMLVLGIPPREELQLDVEPAGLRRAVVEDATVTFEPPSFPAKHVVIERDGDRVEIEHLEVVR